MNPFNFYGPQFLLFYVILTVVLIVAVKLIRRWRELAFGTRQLARLQDPYLIACLRGKEAEVIRVAIVSLVDRGLLNATGTMLVTSDIGKRAPARRAVENALLAKCETPQEATELFTDDTLIRACAEFESELQRHRLVADAQVNSSRGRIFVGALLILLFFSIGKIGVALSRERPFLFLLFLTAIAIPLVARASFPRRTALGDHYLREIRNVFESLKLRAPQIRPGGATAELALLAAVFGVAALPAQEFGWSRTLFPKASASTSSSCGSSSSSCGSSCGGGGGCGGGCGGCGS